ncbi:MAG: hypothetical protein J6Y48_10065 [Clostridia bacterium]|nr:hypothetical protein [Clostridia bacterium]
MRVQFCLSYYGGKEVGDNDWRKKVGQKLAAEQNENPEPVEKASGFLQL